jgi:hypothetical protein
MKKIKVLIATVLVMLCIAGSSSAFTLYSSPLTANMWMSYAGGSSSNTFTLKLDGYDPSGASGCSSAQLILSFTGDGNPFDSYMFAGITQGSKKTIFEVNDGSAMIIPISDDGLVSLNTTGQLTFTLTRFSGDFTFKTARLKADSPTPAVPIPAALWLFGPTLVGFQVMRRQFVRI